MRSRALQCPWVVFVSERHFTTQMYIWANSWANASGVAILAADPVGILLVASFTEGKWSFDKTASITVDFDSFAVNLSNV